jgi:hypothetical protein
MTAEELDHAASALASVFWEAVPDAAELPGEFWELFPDRGIASRKRVARISGRGARDIDIQAGAVS